MAPNAKSSNSYSSVRVGAFGVLNVLKAVPFKAHAEESVCSCSVFCVCPPQNAKYFAVCPPLLSKAQNRIRVLVGAVVLAWEFGGDGKGGPIPAALEALYGLFSPSGRAPRAPTAHLSFIL